MSDSYQFTSKEGDIVQLPNGLLGEVKRIEFHCGGNSKEVLVRPFAPWLTRMWLFLAKKTCFYDDEINSLKFLAKKEKRKEVKK